MTATAKISVKVADGATVTTELYHGTSASAAVVAAVSALYWEFRQWQVDASTIDNLTEVADEDVVAVIKASTLDGGSAGWDRQFGEGVLDAPKALEIPLPASQPTLLTVAPGVVELDFYRALNDLADPSQFTMQWPALVMVVYRQPAHRSKSKRMMIQLMMALLLTHQKNTT